MVQEGYGIYPGRLDRDRNGNLVYVTGANSNGWVNVFALKRRDGKTYYRFGYNLNEQRWAYGTKPQVAEDSLFPRRNAVSPTKPPPGLGWRLLRGTVMVIGKIIVMSLQVIVGMLMAVLAGLLAPAVKGRRRRRTW
jgi:hypothetical protein